MARSRRCRGRDATPGPAKLDDLMMAMDVVDTLRHRERVVERELNEEVREEQLIARLRALYKGQGLDVPDSVIAQGVKALKESRFVYTPPKPGFERWLARVWVKRVTIGKWLGVSLAHSRPCFRDLSFQRGQTAAAKTGGGANRAHANPATGAERCASSDPHGYSSSRGQAKS